MDTPLTAIRYDQSCEICMGDDKEFLMSESCGHLLCESCRLRLRLSGERPFRCPFCRKSLEIQAKKVYKGEISCHICQKLKNCEEIWWCGECRSLLCSDCQLKNHGVSNKSHEIELFAKKGKTKAANVAREYLESRSKAEFLEDKMNYAHHLQNFLTPVVQKIAGDKVTARKEKFLALCNDLHYAFGTIEFGEENQKSLPTDAIVFDQISKLVNLDTTPAPVSLPSQSSYFVAAEVRDSTIKILVESLELSHFNIVRDFFTIVRQNKIFLGKLPEFHSSPVKIPALKLLYKFKDQIWDSEGFEIENRFALSFWGELAVDWGTGITFAVLTKLKSDGSENDQWKITFSDITDFKSTIKNDRLLSKTLDLTEIVPTDSALGSVTEMKICAPRQVDDGSFMFLQTFHVIVNCEYGSEILETNYDPVSGREKDNPVRSIHQASDKVETFASLQHGEDSKLLYLAVVYSGAKEKVITFKVRDTATVSVSTGSYSANDQAPPGMERSSYSFPGPIKSLDFATENKKESRLVIRTEDGDIFVMLDFNDPASEPRKRLSLKENAKLSPVNRTMYAVLDEETGMMRMVIYSLK